MKQLERANRFDEAAFAALKDEIAGYVSGPAEAWAARIERERRVPPELWDEIRARGYLSLAAPAEYGGGAIPFTRYLELIELFSMSHASIRMIVHVVNGTWRAMDRFATAEQRRAFVIPSVKGELKIAFTLTEPTAGTGADLRCSVTREGDAYYLSGEKHLITFGTICDYWLLFARVAGTRGADGTVALLVDRHTPGASVSAMDESMGVRGTDHARLAFDRAPVPVANRLGDEGQGLSIALGGFLTPSRISVAMSCVGLARRAQELAIEYAGQRETFGKTLAQRQAIRFIDCRERHRYRSRTSAGAPCGTTLGSRRSASRDALVHVQAAGGGDAHPRHRQGTPNSRRHRLLAAQPHRARLSRRARTTL